MPSSSQNNSGSASVLTRIGSAIVSLRWVIIVVFSALMVGALIAIQNFKIDASAETLLVKNNKLFIQSQLAAQRFSPDEFILLAYKPTDHALYSQRTFDDLQRLEAQISKLKRVKSVTSILNVPLMDSSTTALGAAVRDLTWQAQEYSPQEMQALLDEHPIYTDLLVNRDATATAVQVLFEQHPELIDIEKQILAVQKNALERELTDEENAEIDRLREQADPIRQELVKQREKEIKALQAIADELQGVSTYMGGSYVVGFHLVDIIQSDLKVFGGAIAAVIALLLAIIYRNLRWVLFPLSLCALSVLATMGLFGFLDLRTTVISANFIALQLILTLAVMIHLIGTYRKLSVEKPDQSQQDRVVGMLRHKLAPCFFATLTTSVGFGSLVFSGIQPVNDFGLMMLLAMLITMSMSLLLFPALLSFLPATEAQHEPKWLKNALGGLSRIAERQPLTVTAVISVLFILLAIGIVRISVENSFIGYFDDKTTVYQELSFIDQEFGGSTPLDIIIDVPEEERKQDLIVSAESLNKLHLVHAAVDAFEATGSLTSLVSFTKLAKEVNDDTPLTEYELDAIYSLLDESTSEKLFGAYLEEDGSKYRLAARVQDTTPDLNREQFLDQLRADLATIGVQSENYQLTNLFVLYQDILSRLVDSQVSTLGIVYAALFVVLLGIFRSLKVALIALVPNVLTTLGLIGLIGWLGIPLDLMTITIAAIAMGIAMDDTIHFVDNTLKADGDNPVHHAFTDTGIAIVYTSGVIAVGFSLFMFSDFLPSVYFGLLSAAAMLFALLTDLTILPALLKRFVVK